MFSSRRLRERAVISGIAALGILLGGLTAAAGLLDGSLQNVFYDTAISKIQHDQPNGIRIVAIDDKTIKAYGVYPLPRQAYADLLRKLKPASPSVVAFDVGFFEPSPDAAADRALAAAIKDSGNVVLAMQGTGSGERVGGTERFGAASFPIKEFRDGAVALGSVNITPEDDGKVRRAQIVIDTPEGRFFGLPLVSAARHLKAEVGALRSNGQHVVLPTRLGDKVIPIDETGAVRIDFIGPPSTDTREQSAKPCSNTSEFCVLSLTDVVQGRVPDAIFLGKSVLIGAHSADQVPDSYATPNSGNQKMYGVEIWGNTEQSVFENRYPVFKQSLPVTVLTLAVVTVVGILLIRRFRLYGFLGALAVMIAYIAVSLLVVGASSPALIGDGSIVIPSVGYLLPGVFWWVVVLGYLLVEEQRAVTRTQTTFGRFVTPSVARTIMDIEESGKLALGGEEKRVTVLFGDVRGFTSMSEGMTPGVLLDTLNRYFEGIVGVVNRYEGTVNKYNGDNIMVLWGAPLPVVDQERKAVSCALEIQRWIVAERAKGGPDVSFGFGINTGPVVAGFLGAMGRMEYTVIGDTANVASRLTSNDIARRDQVAISAETLGALGDDTSVVDLGAIHVKGRAEPVQCYQVDRLGGIENPNPAPAPDVPVGAAAVAGFH